MELLPIRGYRDYEQNLIACGFTLAGANPDGVFTLCEEFESNIRWHTEEPDTDPWVWRLRLIEEREDVAYSKLFFNKGGFIMREFYPKFLVIRRPYADIKAAYAKGLISDYAVRLREAVELAGAVPVHELKRTLGVSREEASRFERTLTELQMQMYITVCGSRQKVSQKGGEYGWRSMTYCTPEVFFGADILAEAAAIDPESAYKDIEARIYEVNPAADERKVKRFIYGARELGGMGK